MNVSLGDNTSPLNDNKNRGFCTDNLTFHGCNIICNILHSQYSGLQKCTNKIIKSQHEEKEQI